MSGPRLLVLGVGDAFSALHYSSSFAVEAHGRWLLIDCPHPIFKMLHEAGQQSGLTLDLKQLDGLVLTHLHADHCSGLEGLAFYYRYILNQRVPLYTHADVVADLWSRSLAAGMEFSLQKIGLPPVQRVLDEFFDVHLLAPGQPATIGSFTIDCRPTIHNIPTIAVRVSGGGRSLGYSADTIFDPNLVEWLAASELVIHEASGTFMHTPYAALAALPEPLRRKIRLIHCPDDFDDANSVLELLHQGQLYSI
jgi:ribonuclease BN (tRNA processing enzyme)